MKNRYTCRIDSMHINFQRSSLSRDDDDYAYFALIVAGQPFEIPNQVMGTDLHSGDTVNFRRAFELSADVADSDSLTVICNINNLSDNDTLAEQAGNAAVVGSKISGFISDFAKKFPGGKEAAIIAGGISGVLSAVGAILHWFDTAKCNGPVFNDTFILSAQQLADHTQNGTVRFSLNVPSVPSTITISQHDCGHQPETIITFSIFNSFSVRQRLTPGDDGSKGIRSLLPSGLLANINKDPSLRHAMAL